ncbi:MAG: DUF4180 domain-containing protein [Bacteroidales bacterium]|nr:DUF4180 domain-containing protein [Bacteroidales bacterium]
MKTEILELNGHQIAELTSDEILISNTQEAVDLMMNCAYQGADSLLIYEHNLTSDFFDLKTKIAGDILQKFSTYQMRLAIVGDYEKFNSKSLRDFIYESNKGGRIFLLQSVEEARMALSQKV